MPQALILKGPSSAPAGYRIPFGDDEYEMTPDDASQEIDLSMSRLAAARKPRIQYTRSEKHTLLKIVASVRVCYESAYNVHVAGPVPELLQAAMNELKMHLQLVPEDPMPTFQPVPNPFMWYSKVAIRSPITRSDGGKAERHSIARMQKWFESQFTQAQKIQEAAKGVPYPRNGLSEVDYRILLIGKTVNHANPITAEIQHVLRLGDGYERFCRPLISSFSLSAATNTAVAPKAAATKAVLPTRPAFMSPGDAPKRKPVAFQHITEPVTALRTTPVSSAILDIRSKADALFEAAETQNLQRRTCFGPNNQNSTGLLATHKNSLVVRTLSASNSPFPASRICPQSSTSFRDSLVGTQASVKRPFSSLVFPPGATAGISLPKKGDCAATKAVVPRPTPSSASLESPAAAAHAPLRAHAGTYDKQTMAVSGDAGNDPKVPRGSTTSDRVGIQTESVYLTGPRADAPNAHPSTTAAPKATPAAPVSVPVRVGPHPLDDFAPKKRSASKHGSSKAVASLLREHQRCMGRLAAKCIRLADEIYREGKYMRKRLRELLPESPSRDRNTPDTESGDTTGSEDSSEADYRRDRSKRQRTSSRGHESRYEDGSSRKH